MAGLRAVATLMAALWGVAISLPACAAEVAIGRLWHNNHALDYQDGVQVSAPGRTARKVSGLSTAYPWPDGEMFVTAQPRASEGRTLLTVQETATGKVVQQLRFKGYLRSIKPCPTDKRLLLATWSEDTLSTRHTVFLDLARSEVIGAQPESKGVAYWLPNGEFIRLAPTGAITRGRVDGAMWPAGQLRLPAGHMLGAASIHPRGTQMALRLMAVDAKGRKTHSDIWVADIDGGSLERVTRTGTSNYAKWSPDGRFLAFDVDTGLVCGGGNCVGSCGLWYAASTARNVLALPSSGDAAKFNVKNSRGEERTLGCELLAWTD